MQDKMEWWIERLLLNFQEPIFYNNANAISRYDFYVYLIFSNNPDQPWCSNINLKVAEYLVIGFQFPVQVFVTKPCNGSYLSHNSFTSVCQHCSPDVFTLSLIELGLCFCSLIVFLQ